MPDRIIRAAILQSDKVNNLSWPGEVFYRRLMSVADDFGRMDARPSMLRANLYPLKIHHVSEPDIVKWMAECATAGLIRYYEANGKKYLEVINFGQRLRAMKSRFPEPPTNASEVLTDDSNSRPEVETEVEVETETEVEVERLPPTLKLSSKEKLKKSISTGREHPFTESEFYEFQKFEAQFKGTDYEKCDLNYYFNRMSNWAAGKGVKRIDWIAQARNFMLGDANENKLKLKNGATNANGTGTKRHSWSGELDELKRKFIRQPE
jgi:hypothetical protein